MKMFYKSRASLGFIAVAVLFLLVLLFFFDSQDGLEIKRKSPFLKYAKENKYFSEDYCEARKRFRNLSHQLLNSQLGELVSKEIKIYKENIKNLSLVEPCDSNELDSEGNDHVTIDVLSVPAVESKKRLLILVSGIHGVEAPVGSAGQLMVLKEFLISKKIDVTNTGVLVVHSLNPYGFKYFRRFNQFNVDLNRNSILEKNASDFFSTSEKLNSKYDEYYSAFNFNGVVPYLLSTYGSFFDRWKRVFFDFVPMLVKGESVAQIFAGGQYRHRNGIYFGGHKRQEEVVFFESLLKKYAQGYKHIFFVDTHTGVGSGERLNILPWVKQEQQKEEMLKLFLNPDGKLKRENFYTLDFGSDEIGYKVRGDVVQMVGHWSKADQTVALTAEYGTHTVPVQEGLAPLLKTRVNHELGSIRTLYWMCREHQGYQYGYENLAAQRSVTQEFVHRFTPYVSKRWVGTGAKRWQNLAIEQMRFLIGDIFLQRSTVFKK